MFGLLARRLLGFVGACVVSCGGSPPPEPASSESERPRAAPAEVEPNGPTAEWNGLVDARLVWAHPELRNYCLGETVALFLPEGTSADHGHVAAARASGCKVLSASPKGATVCCPPSLPVATNPNTGGGKSCEEALLDYEPTDEEEETKSPSSGQFGAVLNRGAYFAHCRVPDSTKLSICAAIQNGSAVGVTVGTRPYQPELAECVAKGVRALKFPSSPRLDVTKTTF